MFNFVAVRLSAILLVACSGLSVQAQHSAHVEPINPPNQEFKLSLLSDEELLPFTDGECSIIFSDRLMGGNRDAWLKFYGEGRWQGPCRFGLAHGEGIFYFSGDIGSPATFIYGVRVYPRYNDLGQAATFYRESADSTFPIALTITGLGMRRAPTSTEDYLADLRTTSSLTLSSATKDGVVENRTIQVVDLQTQCEYGVWPTHKAFESKIRSNCSKEKGQVLAVTKTVTQNRREGNQSKMLQLETCKVGSSQCANVVRKILGTDATVVDAAIRDDEVNRRAYVDALFARGESLERAFAARVAALSGANGAAR